MRSEVMLQKLKANISQYEFIKCVGGWVDSGRLFQRDYCLLQQNISSLVSTYSICVFFFEKIAS